LKLTLVEWVTKPKYETFWIQGNESKTLGKASDKKGFGI
jgi:hypothetical protein